LVIAAQEHLGYFVSAELTRPGVLGKLQQRLVRKRILLATLLVA
jgi:hypothetical protein